MPIVSSTYTTGSVQTDSRYWVEETHVDNAGVVYLYQYLTPAGSSPAGVMVSRAASLASSIKNAEIIGNVRIVSMSGAAAVLNTLYSTPAQLWALLRRTYSGASRGDAVMIADYFGTLTDAQLQAIFSMTAEQITTLRSDKLTPAASLAASIRANAGQ